ncbi:2368_t:CDS:2, partial [Acaulospora colombiana]
ILWATMVVFGLIGTGPTKRWPNKRRRAWPIGRWERPEARDLPSGVVARVDVFTCSYFANAWTGNLIIQRPLTNGPLKFLGQVWSSYAHHDASDLPSTTSVHALHEQPYSHLDSESSKLAMEMIGITPTTFSSNIQFQIPRFMQDAFDPALLHAP